MKFRFSILGIVAALLSFLPLLVQAQTTYDWATTAPDGNWKQGASGSARWNPGGLWDEPPFGIVQFNNNTFPTMTNNVAGTYNQFKINFGSSATSARSIGGNTIQFFDFSGTWPFIQNQSTTTHSLSLPIIIGTGGTFNLELIANAGNLDFTSTINNNGKNLQIYGNNTTVDGTNRAIRLGGVVSGSGVLNVSQFGVVKLNATHTYTGQTQIDNGELWIESSGSIASGSGIFVGNGGQPANVTKFWISNSSGGSTVSNAITINSGNASTRYLGGLNSSGTHTFSGAITNNSTTNGLNLSALTSGGTTDFTGVISGSSPLITEGSGIVKLSGSSANTYTGTTTVNGTLLVLNKSANTAAVPAALTVATGATVRTDANNQFGTGTVPLTTLNGTAIFDLNNTSQKMSLASASSTSSVTLGSGALNLDHTTSNTYAGAMSGTGALTKTNTGVTTLTHTGISYSGTTTLTGGEIRLNPTGNATFASQVILNGGTLGTTGITSTRTWTSSSTLQLTANSTMALLSATAHTLTFANSSAVSWTAGAQLSITGWSGSYNGTTGTGGKIFVGSNATGLTADQLAKIFFYNGTNYFTSTILSTGEVVPTANIAMWWGSTGAVSWTAAAGTRWDPTYVSPTYNTTWTSGRAAIFNVASSTITGATTVVSAITANENVTVTASGTINTNATPAPVYVASGKLFNFAGQAIGTTGGTGFIKNGPGAFQTAGGTYTGGFTLNDGMIAAGGANAMGSGGALTINGGTIGLTGTRDFTGKFTGGITIGGDFTLGSGTSPSVAASNTTFTNNTALGSSATRIMTLGGTGLYTWNGIISGTSSNFTLAGSSAATLTLGGINTFGGNFTMNASTATVILSAANTYGGTTNINNGTVRPTVNNAIPTGSAVSFANTSGATLDLSTTALTHTMASIAGGGSTGGNISFGAPATAEILTINQSGNTNYSGLISGNGAIVKTGAGILTLGHTANTYTGSTTITAGEIRLNPSTTTATFASQIILNGGKLSTTSIAASTVMTSSSTLRLDASSTIDLGSNAHDLKFANSSGVTWGAFTITINGWTGTGGATGTAGRIFFGSAVATLTSSQLSKITFTGYPGTPILLATGELVPAVPGVTYTWNGSSSGAWATPANWSPGTSVAGPTAFDNVVIPDNTLYTTALAITGSVSCNDFTVNSTPTGNGTYSIGAGASLTVGGAYVYGSSVAATFNCTSTLSLSGTGSINVPAHSYGNLDLTGGNRVLASSGTIGICGTFTRGAGAYTVTGSTVDYNGSGAQTISAGTYNNLTISNARGSANLTSPAGTISIAGTFDVSTLSAYTPVVNAASIFDFTGSGQTVPAFFYGQLNNSAGSNRTLASSGIIDIAQGFTPAAGTTTITGSTVQYSNTSATTWNLSVFTTNVTAPARQYNNLIFNGGSTTNWSLNGLTIGVANDLTVTSGTLILGSAAGAATLNIDGTYTLNGANGTTNISSSNTNGGTINLLGNFVQSNGSFTKTGTSTSAFNFSKASGTQTINKTGGTFSAGTTSTSINIGTGATTNTVQLLADFAVTSGTFSPKNLATFDFQTFLLTGTSTFTTVAGTTLMTANTNTTGAFTTTGTNGSIQSSGTRIYTAGTRFYFDGAADQYTGNGVGQNTAAAITINTTSGANVNLTTTVQVTGTVLLTSGVLILNTADLQLNNAATFTGSPWTTSNMIATIGASRYSGRIIKVFPNGPQSNLTFTYPLGDLTGTVEYTPAIINDLDYTTATSPYVDFKVKDAKHPNDPSLNDYLTRYWEMLSSFPSGSGVTMQANFNYMPADVVGTEAVIKMNRYYSPAGSWTEDAGSSAGSNVLTSVVLNGAASPTPHDFDDHDIVGRLTVPLYYRSASAGPNIFELGASWIVSSDPAFLSPTGVAASTYPTYSNSAGIRIMNGHSMTVSTLAGVDDMTVESGATLTLANTMLAAFYVNNGTGTDLTVDGTVVNQSAFAWTVGGTISFSNGALYDHNVALGTVPASTWVTGSECRITGSVNSSPAGLGQAFSDFRWASTMGSSFNLSSALTNVTRDLYIEIKNTNSLGLTATTALSLSVGRDMFIYGAGNGSVNLVTGANANAVSLSIARNLDITGAARFAVVTAASSGVGATSVTVGGTFTNSSTTGGAFGLNASSKTNVTATITGACTYSGSGLSSAFVNGGTGSSTLICNGGFTISSGDFRVSSSLTGTGTLTTAASTTLTVSGGLFIVEGNGTGTVNCNGNAVVSGTGSIQVSIGTGTGTFNLADNQTLTLSGGTSYIANNGTGNMNIGTSTTSSTTTALTLSGGSLNVASNIAGTGNLNIYGNLNLNSGTLSQTFGTATVNFLAQGINIGLPHLQTITQTSATVSGIIAFNVGATGTFTNLTLGSNVNFGGVSSTTVTGFTATNASYLDFGTYTFAGYNFTQSNFGIMVTAHADGFWTIATGPSTGALRTTNSRTLNANGNFSFNGTGTQVVGDAVTSAYNFSVFNSASGVTLSNNLSIVSGGTLFLNFFGLHGKLYLSTFNATLVGTAAISGASSTDYIVTNGTGKLIQTVAASNKDFPVGLSAYNPIRLNNSGTSDTYGVIVVDAVTTPTPFDGTKLINRFWNITEGTAGGSTLATSTYLGYNGVEENANFAAGATLKIGYYNGVAWADYAATQSGGGPYTVSPNASFSPAVASYTLGIGKDDGFLSPSVNYTWNGGTSSSWATSTNWTPNGNPTGLDNVTIPNVGSYTNELNIAGARTVNDFVVNANGKYTMSASSSLSVGGAYTYSSSTASTFDCSSTLSLLGSGAITVPAANYGNLLLTGGARTLASSGTIGICGTYTPGSPMTVTGSTVNYNGTGAQTITASAYNNLTISNARGAANLTSPAGTIAVGGTFDVSTLSVYIPVINAASIFDFTSAGSQSIPAFSYGQLNNSGNGNRTWASSGQIFIYTNFSHGTGLHTVTGSRVDFIGSGILTSFTSSASPMHYNDLYIGPSLGFTYSLASGFDLGTAGTLTVAGAGKFIVCNNATPNTLTITGDFDKYGTSEMIISNSTGLGTVDLIFGCDISDGTLTCVGSSATTGGNAVLNCIPGIFITGTGKLSLEGATTSGTAAATVNANITISSTVANCLDFGASTFSNAFNVINASGLNKSGTGTIGLSGTYAASAGFNFNGSGNYSHSGAGMTGGSITIQAGATLFLVTNLTTASSGNANPLDIAGTLWCFGYTVNAGNAANTFRLQATGELRTSNAGGISGTILGFTNANTTWTAGAPSGGATFTFDGNNVNAGFAGYANILNSSSSTSYNISAIGTGSFTLDKTMFVHNLNYGTSGLFILGANSLTLSSTGAFTGFGFSATKMFVVTTGLLIRSVQSDGTGLPFTWHIGESTGTTEYSPATVSSISGAGINGTIGFRVIDGVHPDMALATSYLSRYWPMTITGFSSGYSLSGLSFQYNTTIGDVVVGPEASMRANSYNSSTADWSPYASSSVGFGFIGLPGVSNSTMPINGTYDVTGRIDVPVYYRSVSGGSWSTPGTWEISSDAAFVSPAPVTPVNPPTTANSDSVLIRNTHTVNVNSAVSIDEVFVKSGGTLNVTTSGTFTLVNGPGAIDMRNDGTMLVATPTTISASAVLFVTSLLRQTVASQITATGTLRYGATGTYEHNHNAGTIPTSTWDAGSTCILKTMTATQPSGLTQSFSNFTVDCPTLGGAGLQFSGNLTTVGGNLTLVSTGAGFVRLSTGAASYTLAVGGNIDVQGGSELDFASGGTNAVTAMVNVTGSLIQAASSTIRKTGAENLALTIDGDFTQNGGTFDFSTVGTTTSTVTLKGNFLENGVVQRGGGTAVFNFHKASGTQTWSQGTPITTAQAAQWNIGNGTTTNTVQFLTDVNIGTSGSNIFTVNSAATLDFQDKILLGTNTVFNMGATSTLRIGSQYGITTSVAGATAGNLQTLVAQRNVVATATYIYSGTVNQATGNKLPATLTGTGKITIDNTGTAGNNTVTLTTNNTTTPQVNLNSGLFAIGSGNTMIISSGGTVNATSGDFATGATGGMVRFSTPSGGSFTGTSNPFNVETNGNPCAVNFGSGTVTIQSGGVFNINTGGSVTGNAPAYASGSTLWYLTGGVYNRGLEWSTTSGKGYPHHVSVSTSTLNPAAAAAVNANVPFRCGGNLTIGTSGNVYMDYSGNNMIEDLRVLGNFNLQGNFSLSQTGGSDLFVGGNWTNNGSGANAFMTGVNGRQVEFNGSSAQTIGGSNGTVPAFDYVSINNSGADVTTNISLTMNQRLQMNSGKLIIGSNNISIGTSGIIDLGGVTSYIVTNGTGYVSQTVNGGNDWYPVGPSTSAFGPVTLNQSGTGETINVRVINVAGLAAPSYNNAVNDTTQMVKLEWVMNESVPGANSLRTTFGWQGAGTAGAANIEGSAYDRTSGVFHGNYNGTKYVVRATDATTGSNPYFSVSTAAQPFTGTMAANQRFVVGNINGILPCNFTLANGLWSNGANWNDGLPVTGQALCINHNIQISSTPANPLIVTVNSPNGNVVIDPGITLTFEAGGTFTNNNAGLSMTTGTVAFQGGTSTLNGSQATAFSNLQLGGNTTLTTTPTINGSLEILPGGFILSATGPNYGASSTLIYNTGGSYNRSNEWNATSGAGFPTSVQVTGGTSLDISNGSNTARAISGNFQVDASSSATMSAMTGNLTVPGNFVLNGTGSFTESSNIGGDIVLGGNWTSSATASFTANNRDVKFNSSTAGQTITMSNPANSFGYLTIDNSSTGVTLATDIHANVFRVQASRTFNLGSPKVIINTGGDVLINGTFNGNTGTVEYTDGGSFTNNGTFNRGTSTIDWKGTSTGTVIGTVQTNFHNLYLAPSSGIDFGSGALRGKVSGVFQLRAGSYVSGNAPIYEPGSKLMYSGGGTFNRNVEWDPSTVQKVEVRNSTTLNCGTNGTTFNHQIADSLIIQSGSTFDMTGPDMTVPTKVGGSVLIAGTLNLSNTGGGDIEVGGDFVNNGTYNCNGRLSLFNGTADASIKGSTNSNFCLLTVSKSFGKTLTATVPFTVSKASGTIVRVLGGTLDLNGQSYTISGATSSLRVDAGFTNGQTLKTGGSSLGSFTNYTDNGVTTATLGGKVNYSGTGAETLVSSVTSYNLLWITGAATKSITQTTGVADSLWIAPSTTLDFGAAASILNAQGHVVNAGTTIGSGTGKVNLNGSSTQNLSGSGTFRNLDVNNSSHVNSSGSPTISSKLNVLLGKVLQATSSDSITLGSSATITETIGGGEHFVRGKLYTSRVVGVAAETFGGLGVELTAGSDLGTVNVTRTSGSAITGIGSSGTGLIGINRYWRVTPTIQPATADRNLTLKWPSQDDNGRDMTTAQIWKSPDGVASYTPLGYVQDVSASIPRVATHTGIASFSIITVSDFDNPLPLSLLNFSGKNVNGVSVLSWKTTNEVDLTGFEVEKSLDGKNFSSIGFVPSTGSKAVENQYGFSDVNLKTNSYYRLKLKNSKGQPEVTESIYIKVGDLNNLEISLFPNPTDQEAQISIHGITDWTGDVSVSLFGTDGRELLVTQGLLSEVNKAFSQSVKELPAGVYSVKVNTNTEVKTLRLMKR